MVHPKYGLMVHAEPGPQHQLASPSGAVQQLPPGTQHAPPPPQLPQQVFGFVHVYSPQHRLFSDMHCPLQATDLSGGQHVANRHGP